MMSIPRADEGAAPGPDIRQLDLVPAAMRVEAMAPHTLALIAAAAFAFATGKKVAGMYDHALEKNLQIAAECRGDQLQGYDGDRYVGFGGQLPEIYDEGDRIFISLEIDGSSARGYDRGSMSSYVAQVNDQQVQVYDHGQKAWFAFDIQSVE